MMSTHNLVNAMVSLPYHCHPLRILAVPICTCIRVCMYVCMYCIRMYYLFIYLLFIYLLYGSLGMRRYRLMSYLFAYSLMS